MKVFYINIYICHILCIFKYHIKNQITEKKYENMKIHRMPALRPYNMQRINSTVTLSVIKKYSRTELYLQLVQKTE